MVIIILMGLGIGVGLAAIVWGLFPPPFTLRAALARLAGEQVTAPTDVLIHGVGGARRLCGHLLEANVRKVPKLADIVLPDLAITGTPAETFAGKVVGYGIGLALLGPVAAIAAGAVGVHPGIEVPALGVLVLGGLGVVTPFIDLHQAATRRRGCGRPGQRNVPSGDRFRDLGTGEGGGPDTLRPGIRNSGLLSLLPQVTAEGEQAQDHHRDDEHEAACALADADWVRRGRMEIDARRRLDWGGALTVAHGRSPLSGPSFRRLG